MNNALTFIHKYVNENNFILSEVISVESMHSVIRLSVSWIVNYLNSTNVRNWVLDGYVIRIKYIPLH